MCGASVRKIVCIGAVFPEPLLCYCCALWMEETAVPRAIQLAHTCVRRYTMQSLNAMAEPDPAGDSVQQHQRNSSSHSLYSCQRCLGSWAGI
jgi:hypothetical protein